jgi:predicted nucleic-acid-binding Zn-ribbon protein
MERLAVMSLSITCPSCFSTDKRNLNGEIALHFGGGLQGLEKPIVWSFPKVLVCLNCGFAEFVLEDDALTTLRQNYTDDELPDKDNLARAV